MHLVLPNTISAYIVRQVQCATTKTITKNPYNIRILELNRLSENETEHEGKIKTSFIGSGLKAGSLQSL